MTEEQVLNAKRGYQIVSLKEEKWFPSSGGRNGEITILPAGAKFVLLGMNKGLFRSRAELVLLDDKEQPVSKFVINPSDIEITSWIWINPNSEKWSKMLDK